MFGIGWTELLVLFGLVLLIFGPKRLPEIGRALAQGLRIFKDASREARESFADVQAEFEEEIRKAEQAKRDLTRSLLEEPGNGDPPDDIDPYPYPDEMQEEESAAENTNEQESTSEKPEDRTKPPHSNLAG